MEVYIHTETRYTIVHNSFIYNSKNWKQSKSPWIGESVNKWLYIHAKEYYLAIKRTEVWIYSATWFNLRIIMLSKQKQTKRVQSDSIYTKP